MPRFTMLIGLPGSGKSTYAAKFAASDSKEVHLSSDQIAKDKFAPNEPADLHFIFSEMHHQTVQALETGKNVIYDATNLASQKRKSFLNRIQNQQAETEAIVFLTPYKILKERNRSREDRDRVPDSVIERYIKSFQFPKRDEKFDRVTVLHQPSHPSIAVQEIRQSINKQEVSFQEIFRLYEAFEETKPLLEFEPIIRQSHELFVAVRKKMQDPIDREVLSWATLLHGIGKPYVRKNRPPEEDNFHGYEHVSWYLAYPILSALGFPQPFIFDVLSIIDEHVEAPAIKRGKLKRRMGLQNYERLQVLLGNNC